MRGGAQVLRRSGCRNPDRRRWHLDRRRFRLLFGPCRDDLRLRRLGLRQLPAAVVRAQAPAQQARPESPPAPAARQALRARRLRLGSAGGGSGWMSGSSAEWLEQVRALALRPAPASGAGVAGWCRLEGAGADAAPSSSRCQKLRNGLFGSRLQRLQRFPFDRRQRCGLVDPLFDDLLLAERKYLLEKPSHALLSQAARAASGAAISRAPSWPVISASTISPGAPAEIAASVNPSVRPSPSRSTRIDWRVPASVARWRR